jgi:hypothetical protein
MTLTLPSASAAPRGVTKPYVNSPGASPTGAAAFTKAASSFYPSVYGGTTTDTTGSGSNSTTTTTKAPIDYQALLANDPILGQTLAGYNAQGIQNQDQLVAGQQRALIQRGVVPTGNLPGVSGIDPTTAQLAAQNTAAGTSTQANLTRAYQQAQQGSDNSLAARGILRSGAYGQHAAENLQGYNQGGYQADQQLMDYLQGLYSGYLQQQQALRGQATTATTDAATRIFEMIKAGQISGGNSGGGGGNNNSTPPPPPPAAPTPTTAAQAIAFKQQSPAYAGARWTAGF